MALDAPSHAPALTHEGLEAFSVPAWLLEPGATHRVLNSRWSHASHHLTQEQHLSLFHVRDREKVRDLELQAFRTGLPADLKVRIRTPSGWCLHQLQLMPVGVQSNPCWLGLAVPVLQDLWINSSLKTMRLQMERALSTEGLIDAVMDHLLDPFDLQEATLWLRQQDRWQAVATVTPEGRKPGPAPFEVPDGLSELCSHPRPMVDFEQQTGLIPMRVDHSCLGALHFRFDRVPPASHELEVLEEHLGLGASALQRVHVIEQEQQAQRTAERALQQSLTLLEIMSTLGETETPEQIPQLTVDAIGQMLSAQVSALLVQGEEHDLTLKASHGLPQRLQQHLTQNAQNCALPFLQVVQENRALYFDSRQALLEDHPELAAHSDLLPTSEMAFLPLKAGDRVLGVLFLGFNAGYVFREHEQAFLEALADQVAKALERAELYRLESELRRQQRETLAALKAILDNAPVGIAMRDQNLRFKIVNHKQAEYYHLTPDQLENRQLSELFPESAEVVDPLAQHVLRTGQPLEDLEFSGHHVAGDEVRHWLSSYFPIRDSQGAVTGVGSMVLDITERKKVERALRESQHFLERITDTTPALIYLYDFASHRTIYANKHVMEVMGWSPEAVASLGTQAHEGDLHPDDQQGTSDFTHKLMALKDGETLSREYRVMHRDGQWHWLHARVTVFSRDAEGQVQVVLGAVLDITDRKQAEEAIQRSERQLRDLTEAQKRFVADAAHEFRTPLTAIQGNLDLLVRYPGIPDQDRWDIMKEVQGEATRLGRLVHDMLQLARSDAGVQLRKDTVDLQAILLDAWKDIQLIEPQRNYQLSEMVSGVVIGDSDRLKQLAMLLLNNAVKYTHKGQTIGMGLQVHGAELEFRIWDSGMGISEEDLPRVFERFYRADKSRHRGTDPGGTGLGLPIAKWIVEQHHGRIWLESELGEGTTVVVRIPGYEALGPN